MTKRSFAGAIILGAVLMDLINTHLWRMGSLVHWIDLLALAMWPVLFWCLWPIFRGRVDT